MVLGWGSCREGGGAGGGGGPWGTEAFPQVSWPQESGRPFCRAEFCLQQSCQTGWNLSGWVQGPWNLGPPTQGQWRQTRPTEAFPLLGPLPGQSPLQICLGAIPWDGLVLLQTQNGL